MPVRDLSSADQEAIRRSLVYQLEVWDWEAPTILGVEEDQMRAVLSAWPNVADDEKDGAASCAIHNSLGDLIGLRGITEQKCSSEIGVSRQELFEVFKRWKGESEVRTPLDFLT